MANDAEKLPKPETAKPQKIERPDSTPRDKELTDEQLRNISGGGGEPPVVVD
jgi:bacteriocin-like protein